MRTSCNGCRVLRKGCSEDCNIRPCIQWIKSSEYQANATLFLAKFYGRAGLMNLINAGPDHLRPAIFKSLLYEACGRIVDPIQGSVGLLWSGNWHHCQAAVDAVLKGSQIMQIHPNPDAAASHLTNLPNAAYDIRHSSRDTSSAASPDSHKVKMTRTRSKRTRSKREVDSGAANLSSLMSAPFGKSEISNDRGASHDPDESMFSAQTVEASLVNRANPDSLLKYGNQIGDDSDVGLELSLSLPYVVKAKGQSTINGSDHGGDKMDVGS